MYYTIDVVFSTKLVASSMVPLLTVWYALSDRTYLDVYERLGYTF